MRRRLALLLRRLLLVALALYGAAVALLVAYRFVRPPATTVQLQRRAEALLAPGAYRPRRTWVSIDALPRHVPRAVVAAEDSRFYRHSGFDFEEIHAALEQAERGGRPVRGASTITQQLVKNLFLTTHRSVLRKGAELALTPAAELVLPKRRILELYLNEVEWGPGIFGIEEAARYHYGVPARRLTREQAARLAAILPAPRTRRPARMGAYAAVILRRMRVMGW